MGTRGNIGIFSNSVKDKLQDINYLTTKFDCLIYQHWDSYSEAMVPNILPFIKYFRSIRGTDSCYLCASLITWLKLNHSKTRNIQNMEDICLTGHGISKSLQTDIEFYYIVDDTNLYVFEASCWEKPYKLKLIETHSLAPEQVLA